MKAASAVVRYIESIEGFQIERPFSPNRHMGSLITDAVLQAGIDFESVVRPRVERIRRHREAATTSGFLTLLRSRGVNAVLDWRGGRKPGTVLEITELLAAEGVDTAGQLKRWLGIGRNRRRLRLVNGVGPKTVDYVQTLVGIPTVAPDLHLKRFLKAAGVVAAGYDEERKILLDVAARLRVPADHLDYTIWKYMSGRNRLTTRSCRS